MKKITTVFLLNGEKRSFIFTTKLTPDGSSATRPAFCWMERSATAGSWSSKRMSSFYPVGFFIFLGISVVEHRDFREGKMIKRDFL
ncbi:hypothetical protein [Treponema pectinovorum]|uniref:hypothetical protein n=1 Tax=Treponema pectinovorum TaxID=164 RepID=UPI0011F40538|nr:hypothetical protein [Treponema pectinovorum]